MARAAVVVVDDAGAAVVVEVSTAGESPPPLHAPMASVHSRAAASRRVSGGPP
ncbi:MAG TPA: hypothetical protein VFJ85_09720 [Acidimicrobiales bacterium]|nr:hypothetical protein [Acidimicrobiales bacterium]